MVYLPDQKLLRLWVINLGHLRWRNKSKMVKPRVQPCPPNRVNSKAIGGMVFYAN